MARKRAGVSVSVTVRLSKLPLIIIQRTSETAALLSTRLNDSENGF